MNILETAEKLADEMIEEDFPLVFDTLMKKIKKMDTLEDLRESLECTENRLERKEELSKVAIDLGFLFVQFAEAGGKVILKDPHMEGLEIQPDYYCDDRGIWCFKTESVL